MQKGLLRSGRRPLSFLSFSSKAPRTTFRAWSHPDFTGGDDRVSDFCRSHSFPVIQLTNKKTADAARIGPHPPSSCTLRMVSYGRLPHPLLGENPLLFCHLSSSLGTFFCSGFGRCLSSRRGSAAGQGFSGLRSLTPGGRLSSRRGSIFWRSRLSGGR